MIGWSIYWRKWCFSQVHSYLRTRKLRLHTCWHFNKGQYISTMDTMAKWTLDDLPCNFLLNLHKLYIARIAYTYWSSLHICQYFGRPANFHFVYFIKIFEYFYKHFNILSIYFYILSKYWHFCSKYL